MPTDPNLPDGCTHADIDRAAGADQDTDAICPKCKSRVGVEDFESVLWAGRMRSWCYRCAGQMEDGR